MLDREPLSDGRTRLTFSLPPQDPPGEVSVVGSFNGWRAGYHTLQPSAEGLRRVSVVVESGNHHFRYLATDDRWGDEPDADLVNEHGSMVYCPPPEPSAAQSPHGSEVGADGGAEARAEVGAVAGSRVAERPGSGARTRTRPATPESATKPKRTPVRAASKTATPRTTSATSASAASAQSSAAKPAPSDNGRARNGRTETAGLARPGKAGTGNAAPDRTEPDGQERGQPQPSTKAGKATSPAKRRPGKGGVRQPAG